MAGKASTMQMKITKLILQLRPQIISTEEAIETLVLNDSIDYNTGMEFSEDLKNRKEAPAASASADNDSGSQPTAIVTTEAELINNKLFEGDEPFSVAGPDDIQGVVIRASLALATPDEQADFLAKVEALNLSFQNIYRIRRNDIINCVTPLVGINPADALKNNVDEAQKIAEALRAREIKFIRH